MLIKSEKELSSQISEMLKNSISSTYSIENEEILLYKRILYFNDQKDKKNPHGFKTDILIKEKEVPLVVIELKNKNFNSHDILTYSSKARKICLL
ncbi:MAG: hypothetical protein ACLQQ4_12180 [Bacteroidia bacterium]